MFSHKAAGALSTPPPHLLWPLVIVAIGSLSCASILIRMADAPSLAVATYRVVLASLLLGPLFARKALRTRDPWTKKTALACALSGLCLALHFIFWIHSIGLTSISSSTTLVSTTPLFAALFSRIFLGERMGKTLWWGLGFTLLGSAIVAGADFSVSHGALLGDLLAILGAVMAAGYLMCGRYARQTLQLPAYVFASYSIASLVLLAGCLLTQTPLRGFSMETYGAMILLALVPQLIGHTLFNWTLKFLSPTSVAVLILGEPIGATLLAFLLLQETLPWPRAAGLLILGMGIIRCSRAALSRKGTAEP